METYGNKSEFNFRPKITKRNINYYNSFGIFSNRKLSQKSFDRNDMINKKNVFNEQSFWGQNKWKSIPINTFDEWLSGSIKVIVSSYHRNFLNKQILV